jgi:perosamine synthetase
MSIENHEFIPVAAPLLTGNEKAYLLDCIDTGWISSEGQYVTKLERALAARMGRKHGVAVANGSVALEAAIVALGIGVGDEVIVPTLTIISCVAAIVRAGATPVTVDCDPLTWNMDVDDVEMRINERTRAIMVVHIYGLPCNMDGLTTLAERHSLKLIEDAAEMHGQMYRDRACGSFGDLSTFSFYANKNIAAGEGGMILTNDDNLAEICRNLANNTLRSARRFVHEALGWNFRLGNLQAAVALAQMERLDETISRKRQIGSRYRGILSHCSQLQLPVEETSYALNSYWVFAVVLRADVSFDADEAIRRMNSLGIGCRPFFWPMHEQPVFRNRGMFDGVSHPHAEFASRRGFYIPSGPAITDAQIERSATALLSIMA